MQREMKRMNVCVSIAVFALAAVSSLWATEMKTPTISDLQSYAQIDPAKPAPSDWSLLLGTDLQDAIYDKTIWSQNSEKIMSATQDIPIWSKKKYTNFVLYFEFSVEPKSNSGVFFKCSDMNDFVPNSLEVQIFDSFGRTVDTTDCGAIYGRVTPSANPCKAPGEWNAMYIVNRGDVTAVFLNGVGITLMDKSLYTNREVNPNGDKIFPWLTKKAPSEMENSGHIGFQGRHAQVPTYFKNIRIKELL